MKKIILLLLPLCFYCIHSFAQPFQVGHKQQTFVDASRSNRNITAEIYYPSDVAGDNVAIAAGQFPILVFGHGFVMVWSAYAPEWNAIVPSGYIMVFPTTETSFSPSHLEFGKDIAFLVGALKTEGLNGTSTFFGAVANTSAVMGHSMGGGSAFLSVQYDPTITALATFAAANTNPSSISAATSITIPSIVFAGANDCVAPPAQHQKPMYDSLISSCKTYVSITGGSHCQFANVNTNCYFGEGTCNPQPTINPALQQSTTFNLVLPWLNYYLKNDCAAGDQFQNLISTGSGITSQQNCSLLCAEMEEQQPNTSMTIYPNPFSSSTTLRTNIPLTNANLTVYNYVGQIVKEIKNISGQMIILSRDELPNGLYFVKLTEGYKIIAFDKIVLGDK